VNMCCLVYTQETFGDPLPTHDMVGDVAALSNRSQSCQRLVDAARRGLGADVLARNSSGQTPAMVATAAPVQQFLNMHKPNIDRPSAPRCVLSCTAG
jgi:hypothetical protein